MKHLCARRLVFGAFAGMMALVAALSLIALAPAAEQAAGDTQRAVIERTFPTPDGGTAVVRVPVEYVDVFSDAQLQEFADHCQNGDTVNIESVGYAK